MSSAHLIIGANRGIGYGLVVETVSDLDRTALNLSAVYADDRCPFEQLKVYPNATVFATTRNAATSTQLKALSDTHPGRVEIVELDVVKQDTIDVSCPRPSIGSTVLGPL